MIYFNNAATSYPKPDTVINSITDYLKSAPFNLGRSSLNAYREDIIFSCRKKIADLLKIKNPNNIIFTSGATESLNLALFGLELSNCHVITTSTEHNSVLRPLKIIENEKSAELSIVNSDINGFIDPEAIASEIKENTKAIIVNHCSNVTGTVINLKRISEIASANRIHLIVDMSQSVGLMDIDISEINADMVAFTGHKGLYGMAGIGGLYIKEGLKLKPLKFGGTGFKSESLDQPDELPIYYEAGTQNIPGIISLSSGIDFLLQHGINNINKKITLLTSAIIDGLKSIPGVTIYGNKDCKSRSGIISFNIEGFLPLQLGYMLENSFNIIIRSGLHCSPLIHRELGTFPNGTARISLSYFNTEKEVKIFIKVIRQICKSKVQNGYNSNNKA